MDDVDLATELNAKHQAAALAAHRAGRPSSRGASAKECEDCGDPIPGDRRRAVRGCTRCCPCQTAFERRNR